MRSPEARHQFSMGETQLPRTGGMSTQIHICTNLRLDAAHWSLVPFDWTIPSPSAALTAEPTKLMWTHLPLIFDGRTPPLPM